MAPLLNSGQRNVTKKTLQHMRGKSSSGSDKHLSFRLTLKHNVLLVSGANASLVGG